MERPNAWKKYDDATLAELAEDAGYVSLETVLAEGRTL